METFDSKMTNDQFTEWMGVDRKTLTRWKNAGVVEMDGKLVNVQGTVRLLVRQRSLDSGENDLKAQNIEADTELKRASTRIKTIEAEERERNLIPVEDVHEWASAAIGGVRDWCESLTDQLEAVGAVVPGREQKLHEAVRAMQTVLSIKLKDFK